MSLIYAFRRTAFYPHPDTATELPREGRAAYLRAVRALGFEGLELGVPHGSEDEIRTLRRELEEAGLPCRAVRGGGPSLQPGQADGGKARMEAALRAAAAGRGGVLNASV